MVMKTSPKEIPARLTRRRFVFLTLPNYSLIALASAVEALRMANRVTKQDVYAWTIASLDGTPQQASNGLSMSPTEPIDHTDTPDILFVCGGAFSGLEKVIENRTEASGIGFSATVKSKKERSLTQVFNEVEPEDLIKFGLIPELVGRMPVVATLTELTEEALVQILTEPKNALVKQFGMLLNMEGVDLEIRPAALTAIAKKALARKTGARGLRSILEQALINTMFDLPNEVNVEKVVVDESTIEENQSPLLVYRESAKQA